VHGGAPLKRFNPKCIATGTAKEFRRIMRTISACCLGLGFVMVVLGSSWLVPTVLFFALVIGVPTFMED
jgi:hypothetical protein